MFIDTVKQLLEDIRNLTDDILADPEAELDGDDDKLANLVRALDEAEASLEDAITILK